MEKEKNNLVTLDVRPTIQSGRDPFDEIMSTVKELKDDQTLEIINVFEPIPLINKLKSMGFDSEVVRKDGAVHTYFKKTEVDENEKKKSHVYKPDPEEFDKTLAGFGDKVRTIDVRPLEMPEPMVTILKEIETLEPDWVLFVEHKKIPQYLLPELEERNFNVVIKELEDNHVQLLIFKS